MFGPETEGGASFRGRTSKISRLLWLCACGPDSSLDTWGLAGVRLGCMTGVICAWIESRFVRRLTHNQLGV